MVVYQPVPNTDTDGNVRTISSTIDVQSLQTEVRAYRFVRMVMVFITLGLLGMQAVLLCQSQTPSRTVTYSPLKPTTRTQHTSPTKIQNIGSPPAPTVPSSSTKSAVSSTPHPSSVPVPVPISAATSTAISPRPPHAPTQTTVSLDTFVPSKSKCSNKLDYEFINKLRKSEKTLCSFADNSPSVTFSELEGVLATRFQSARFRNVEIDLSAPPIQVVKEIPNCSKDGGGHDPRFLDFFKNVHCHCEKEWAGIGPESIFATPATTKEWSCSTKWVVPTDLSRFDRVFENPVFLIFRKDEHNPFFMFSHAFNAWAIAKARGISLQEVTFLSGDHAELCEFPIAEIFDKLGRESRVSMYLNRGKKFFFKDLTTVSSEYGGVIMQFLNDKHWECDGVSPTTMDFRNEVLDRFGVREIMSEAEGIHITIISRPKRNRDGRRLDRVLQNEDILIAALRSIPGVTVHAEQFTTVPMKDQLVRIRQSDVIIGVHGAGMAHVVWAQPGTIVVELLSRQKKRFSFRRISAYVGLRYYEYRAGIDLVHEDKRVDSNHFKCFIQKEWDCIIERKLALREHSDGVLDRVSTHCGAGSDTHQCFSIFTFRVESTVSANPSFPPLTSAYKHTPATSDSSGSALSQRTFRKMSFNSITASVAHTCADTEVSVIESPELTTGQTGFVSVSPGVQFSKATNKRPFDNHSSIEDSAQGPIKRSKVESACGFFSLDSESIFDEQGLISFPPATAPSQRCGMFESTPTGLNGTFSGYSGVPTETSVAGPTLDSPSPLSARNLHVVGIQSGTGPPPLHLNTRTNQDVAWVADAGQAHSSDSMSLSEALSSCTSSPPPTVMDSSDISVLQITIQGMISCLHRISTAAASNPEFLQNVDVCGQILAANQIVAGVVQDMAHSSPSPPLSPSRLAHSIHSSNIAQPINLASPQHLQVPTYELRVSEMEQLWYADRPYPSVEVELVDCATGHRATNMTDRSVQVSLLDGTGAPCDKLAGQAASLSFTFPLVNGCAEITGLRFSAVSSKFGGHFQLRFDLSPEYGQEPVPAFLSPKLQVLSYRLFHAPKVDFSKLLPHDPLSKVKGIGSMYAKRFSRIGVKTVAQLAELEVESLIDGDEQSVKLLECLRRDRGALTLTKLAEYISQARDIVKRQSETTL